MFLLTVLFFLMLPVGAVQSEWVFQNAYVLDDLESGELEKYLTDPLDDFSGHWEFLGDAVHPDKDSIGKLEVLFTDEYPEGAGFMEFQYLEPSDLREADSLAFGIYIHDRTEVSGTETDGLPAGIYQVSVITSCGGQEQTSVVYLEGNRWYIVYSDLPQLVLRRDVDSVRIRLDYSSDTVPGQVQLTSVCASGQDSVFVTYFSAETVEAALGEVQADPNRLHLIPDAGGAVNLTAAVNLPKYVPGAAGWYMAVKVVGTAEGGELSAGVSYAGDGFAETEEVWMDTASVEVLEGSHTYLFPLPLPETGLRGGTGITAGYTGQSVPEPEAYRLSFQNVVSASATPFRVTEVELIPVSAPLWQNSGLGSMTDGMVREGEIIWEGKLNRQAVIDYIDADIALMALPLWDRYNTDAAAELARTPVSNSFSFTMAVNDAETYAAGWLFYAAIRMEDMTQDPEAEPVVTYLPVTSPVMLAGTDPAPCNLSLFGFHDASAVGVYESNVSHVTVDVMLDQLILESGTGTACSFGGKNYILSQTYLAALDSEVLFYSDAGLEVSLRFLSAEPFAWTDMAAENYLPLAETEEDLCRFAAALSYLCRRYSSVASITLGKGINCEKYTGLSLENPEQVMEQTAALAALAYQTARLSIPDIYVVIPFSDGHAYDSEKLLPDHGQVLDPEWAVILLAAAMERLGDVPWVASWRFEDDGDLTEAVSLPERWRHVLQRMNLPVFGDFLYRWEPEACLASEPVPYDITDRYEALCRTLAAANPRAVILSFARIADYVSQSMYAAVTALPDPTGDQIAGRKVENFTAALLEGGRSTEAYTTAVPMWDFTLSYDTEGFVTGGGIEELFTVCSKRLDPYTGQSYSRVLRSELPVSLYEDSTAGLAGGILLRNFEGMADLSGVDCLQFTFTLTGHGDNAEAPTVAFLIGAEDWRAEYHVTGVIDGEVMTAVCDLREYENAARTGYIGVMLYGGTELTFDLSSVYACSSRAGEEEILALLDPSETTDSGSPYATEVFYILVLLAVSSICISIMLFRRDREEEGEEHDRKRG